MLPHDLALLLTLFVQASNVFGAVLTATTDIYFPFNHGNTRDPVNNGELVYLGQANGFTSFRFTEPQSSQLTATIVEGDNIVVLLALVNPSFQVSYSCNVEPQITQASCFLVNIDPEHSITASGITTDTLDSLALFVVGVPGSTPTPTPAPSPTPSTPAPAPPPPSSSSSPRASPSPSQGNQNGNNGGNSSPPSTANPGSMEPSQPSQTSGSSTSDTGGGNDASSNGSSSTSSSSNASSNTSSTAESSSSSSSTSGNPSTSHNSTSNSNTGINFGGDSDGASAQGIAPGSSSSPRTGSYDRHGVYIGFGISLLFIFSAHCYLL